MGFFSLYKPWDLLEEIAWFIRLSEITRYHIAWDNKARALTLMLQRLLIPAFPSALVNQWLSLLSKMGPM